MNNLTVTVLALAFLLTLFGCETMQQIDKSLYEITDSVTETDKVTGHRTFSKDRQAQISEGNAPIDAMLQEADEKGYPYNEKFDHDAYQRVVKIFTKIHAVSHLKAEDWTVLLIPKEEFNAFVTGGTYIVVYSGLERELTDDAELAAVLGHEFAHVSANHIGESQAHKGLTMLTQTNSAGRDSYQAAYTHENEEEADQIGILYAALAGYDPYASSRVWQRKYQHSGDTANIFVDHPVYSERAQQTLSIAKLVERYYTPGEINPNSAVVLKDNALFSFKQETASIGGDGSGALAALTATLESYNKHQLAKIEEKRQRNRIAMLKAVNNLLTVKRIDQISTNQWSLLVHYSGNKAIDKLKFNGTFFQGQRELTSFTGQSKGYWSPSNTYKVTVSTATPLPLRTKVSAYVFQATEALVY